LARKQSLKYVAFYFLLSLIFLSCANQLSPPGGEKDSTPPTIISSYPENGKTNFDDNTIEFSFSEYVNKRNINDAFFISPLIEETPEFSWTNKTVSITLNKKLKPNTTYSIIIGTEISDVNNNNKMAAPFLLTFSTGSKIDSGIISGKVYSSKVDGTLIFAYKNPTDTLNIYKNKPDYVSQVDKKGFYQLSGLGSGIYELFAIKDEFKNLVYDKGEDKIGFTNKLVHISDSTNKIENINFFLAKEDTLPPNIQSITMTDKNHIVIEFNEPIDSSLISPNNFEIIDSTKILTYSLKYIFHGNPRKSEYIICTSDSFSTGNEYFLIAKNIQDIYKNNLGKQEISFTPNEKADTNYIKISKVVTEYNNNTIDYESPEFEINFSDGFDISNAKEGIIFYDLDSSKIPAEIERIDDASINVKISKKLKPKSNFKFSVNLKYFKNESGNFKDTVITNKISTVGNMDFSGLSGEVKSGNKKNVKIVLESIESKNKKGQKNLNPKGKFNYERVIPGKYLLWIYEDSDSNNVFSFGNFDEHKFAEEFKFYPDTLNLRPRWPVGDIEINFEN
jgi:hypothetical protein